MARCSITRTARRKMSAEPTVELLNYTEDAINLLVFTKSSRLLPGATYQDVVEMDCDTKREHLEYMFDTIQTSFEFVDYVFHIRNVSRAFTHQLVRTRPNSYQQQAMRVVDARNFTYLQSSDHELYDRAAKFSLECYGDMIDSGVDTQDARGILPTAIHTEISVKANLRTLAGMAELRLCKRAEGEYQKVFKMIVAAVLDVHPWAEQMLQAYCVKYSICAFPRYEKCPIQQYCFKPESIRERIKYEWEASNHVAAPKADENGMTM